jgi:(1->4)-alpha-D-glucan 1-alpha-D-glucosylmutase
MAKSVEDTAFYRMFPLASLNEVGSNPARAEISIAAFHHHNQRRAQLFPHQMLASTTHDTKRSEDVRARINVLSECPQAFADALQRWARINRRHLTEMDGERLPSSHHEYLLYQTLIGTWPERVVAATEPDYADRIVAYMQKAAREGKEQSSWFSPDMAYEGALERFIRGILEAGANNPFPDDLTRFVTQLIPFGRWNSLVQSLLQTTVPGMPDIYQGIELEALSLVDPDNRRPVDYAKRRELLDRLLKHPAPADRWETAWAARDEGTLKLHLLVTILTWRREDPALFQRGSYLPLTVSGPRADHLCAFARIFEDRAMIVLAPRLLHTACQGDPEQLNATLWTGTRLQLDADLPAGPWQNLLTGAPCPPDAWDDLSVALSAAPMAVLRAGS